MNRQERDRLLACLTDDELAELRRRGADVGAAEDLPAEEDPTLQFLRAVKAERDRDWIGEVAERLGLPAQPKPRTFPQVFTNPDNPTP